METILNTQFPDFSVQAFHNGSFKTITSNDVKGKWAIFFFYPADFTFVCPTELGDIAEASRNGCRGVFGKYRFALCT